MAKKYKQSENIDNNNEEGSIINGIMMTEKLMTMIVKNDDNVILLNIW